MSNINTLSMEHGDGFKWKHFPCYRPFTRGIHLSPVNAPHKGQWRGALMFSLICASTTVRVNNRDSDDLRRHRAHYDVIIMMLSSSMHEKVESDMQIPTIFCIVIQMLFILVLLRSQELLSCAFAPIQWNPSSATHACVTGRQLI